MFSSRELKTKYKSEFTFSRFSLWGLGKHVCARKAAKVLPQICAPLSDVKVTNRSVSFGFVTVALFLIGKCKTHLLLCLRSCINSGHTNPSGFAAFLSFLHLLMLFSQHGLILSGNDALEISPRNPKNAYCLYVTNLL